MRKVSIQVMPDWINDWFMLDNFLKKLDCIYEVNEIELDFYYLHNIHPKGIVMLLTVSNNIFKLTQAKIKIININSEVLSFLEQVNFFKNDLFDIDYTSVVWDEIRERPFYESVIEITQVNSHEGKIRLVSKIKDMLEIWFPEDKYRSLKHSTLSSVMELCGNSLEHSETTINFGKCFVLMQKSIEREYIEMNLVTTDLGIGIKLHQERRYGVLYKNDHEYIEKALTGTTGRLDGTGGFGLQTIQILIGENFGELLIRSGRGTVSVSDGFQYAEGEYGTIGTQCAITLRKPLNQMLT
ncbi:MULTISPECIES: hypothetical protein [unclassified Brevibacillus]|uniref:hypothetical protein n=1 Tax=unclassified Brevibacillus TaxID=2684853 RepID=UPI0035673F3E